MTRPNYPGTRIRGIRIDDQLWTAVTTKAAAENRTPSNVVRDYLRRWVAQPVKEK